LVSVLGQAGYCVAFSHRASRPAADSLHDELEGAGVRALSVECDVGVKAQVDAFIAQAADWHGAAPALLVNNAGVQTWSTLLDLPEDKWDDVIRTNLKGCFLNTQAAARLMKASGRGGAIVNIGSGCNKVAFPRLVDYTASKGGIEQFTKVAAVELGPFGITVNCVAPGAIATERTFAEAPDYAAAWSPITPLRRVGTPADVAGVVLFFASPAAAFVTGQTLWVDGGVFTRANWPYAENPG
jgi:NAD(P)-dependent dehydrogenase (short-subunit alcohol dehydrogenase family)